MSRGLAVVAAAVVAGAAVAGAGAQRAYRVHLSQPFLVKATPSTRPLRTALMDPNLFPAGPQQAEAFARTRAAGATYVRLTVFWANYVPAKRPSSGFDASDPDSPEYTWTELDQVVRAATDAGLAPILVIHDPPRWADVVPRVGTFRGPGPTPKISALRPFAHALALHYDGKHGAPAVHVFQVWNEPNLSLDMEPVSPGTYRRMVNAAAGAVHEVDPANLVVAGGLDAFGHPKSKKQVWYSIAPLAFMRRLLCVSRGAHPHRTCNAAVHFDVWSHHPYTFDGPFGHARITDDVWLGDLPQMNGLLRAAERLHQIVSTHKVEFWVTEFAWDTNPPNRTALKLALQARATAESLYQMWRSGISLATWFLLQDEPLRTPFQCGLYFGGKRLNRPKPTLTAFRFPLVAYRRSGVVRIWGRDATSTNDLVTIQVGHRGRWRTVAQIPTNSNGIFLANLRVAVTKEDWVRAQAPGSGTSLAFSLKQPHYPHIGPFGS